MGDEHAIRFDVWEGGASPGSPRAITKTSIPMRHYLEDVGWFVRTSPYITLMRPNSAIRFLRLNAEAGEECQSSLLAYPDLRIDPLAFFYTCLNSLGALDQPFFESLLLDNGWRGAVWAAWLSMLAPCASFLDPLRAVAPKVPHNRWIVECALATIEGRAPADHTDVVALAARFRQCLEGVPRPSVALRPEPTKEDIARMNRERSDIGFVYTNSGTNAALRCLPGTLVAFYAQDDVRWVRSRGMESRSDMPTRRAPREHG